MNNLSKSEKIEALEAELFEYDRSYYSDDVKAVPDDVYDLKKAELKELYGKDTIPTHSILYKVGTAPESKDIVRREIPMMSIDWVNTEADLLKWVEPETDYRASLKLDGLALSIVYKGGKFAVASTRGDRYVGDNVTEAVRNIEGVPATINQKAVKGFHLEVRGEAFLPKDRFDNKLGVDERSIAAGAIRSKKDVERAGRIGICFIPYEVTQGLPSSIKSVQESLNWLRDEVGIPLWSDLDQVTKGKDLYRYAKEIASRRKDLDYPIDGVVFRHDSIAKRVALGNTSTSYRDSLAFKFHEMQAKTKVIGVDYSLAATGVITPVALVEPVKIGTRTVNRVNLKHYQIIENVGIGIGTEIYIKLAGDVIPDLVGLAGPAAPVNQIIRPPKECLECGSPVIRDGVLARCSGVEICESQMVGSIVKLLAKDALDVDGFGVNFVGKLVRHGGITDLASVLRLEVEDLLEIKSVGEKTALNLSNNLKKRLETPVSLDRLLIGIGIPTLGKVACECIGDYYGDVAGLLDAASYSNNFAAELEQLSAVGRVAAKNLNDFLNSTGIMVLTAFELAGLRVEPDNRPRPLKITVEPDTKLSVELHNRIRSAGITPRDLYRDTDYLVTDKFGRNYEKAGHLGVEIITPEEFELILIKEGY